MPHRLHQTLISTDEIGVGVPPAGRGGTPITHPAPRWIIDAATLTERLAALDRSATPSCADQDSAEQIVHRWAERLAEQGDRIDQRLAGLCIDRDDVARLVATPVVSPAWRDTALSVGEEARALGTSLDVERDGDWTGDEQTPFATMLRPWVDFARRSVAREIGDTNELALLAPVLLSRLTRVSTAAILVRFRAEAARREQGVAPYRSFVRRHLVDGFEQLFNEYPVLGRNLALLTNQWIAASSSFVRRWRHDRAALADAWRFESTDETSSIVACGDPHNGGQQVLCVELRSGRKLIYKPRSLAPEVLFAAAVAEVSNATGFDITATPRLFDRGCYGWAEFVETQPIPDRTTLVCYSQRAGVVAALAHVLAVTDLHFDNVIVAGDRPVLIDLECIASSTPHHRLAATAYAEFNHDTVVGTMLLPFNADDRPLATDISGLTGNDRQVTGEFDTVWRGLGTATMRTERVATTVRGSSTRPGRSDVPPLDPAAMLEGMRIAFGVIERRGLGIDFSRHLSCRFLHRSTGDYVELIRAACTPENLQDGLTFSLCLDAGARVALDADAAAWCMDFVELERRDMENLDVPLAVADWTSTDVTLGGAIVRDVLALPGKETVRRRLAGVGLARHDAQVAIASLALDVRFPAVLQNKAEETFVEAMDVCRAIAVGLHRTALDTVQGIQWLNAMEGPGGRAGPGLGGTDLYTGAAGVAIFLAALARLDGDGRHADLARRAIDGALAQRSADVGWGEGYTGVAYAAALVGQLLDDRSIIRRAAGALHSVATGDVPPTVDVMNGLSGVAAAHAAVGSIAGDESSITRSLQLAHAARDAFQRSMNEGFLEMTKVLRLGVAHGITGTALCVARVLETADDGSLREWLAELVACENERIAARDGKPGRVSPDAALSVDRGWCWGTAGFVAARRIVHGVLGTSDSRRFVPEAQYFTAHAALGVHRLCCGAAGVVAVIDAKTAEGERAKAALIDSFGHYRFEERCGFQNPSLFRGQAGVGYALLRTVDQSLPDVLSIGPGGAGAGPFADAKLDRDNAPTVESRDRIKTGSGGASNI